MGADDRIVLQTTFADVATEMAARIVEDVVAERHGGALDRLPRDNRPGAGEGAGVVGRSIGVAIDDGNAAGPRAKHGRGDLAVRGGRAVAHLGRADREMIAAV